jgi:hypothetical protein
MFILCDDAFGTQLVPDRIGRLKIPKCPRIVTLVNEPLHVFVVHM